MLVSTPSTISTLCWIIPLMLATTVGSTISKFVVILNSDVSLQDAAAHMQSLQAICDASNEAAGNSRQAQISLGIEYYMPNSRAYVANLHECLKSDLESRADVLMVEKDSTVYNHRALKRSPTSPWIPLSGRNGTMPISTHSASVNILPEQLTTTTRVRTVTALPAFLPSMPSSESTFLTQVLIPSRTLDFVSLASEYPIQNSSTIKSSNANVPTSTIFTQASTIAQHSLPSTLVTDVPNVQTSVSFRSRPLQSSDHGPTVRTTTGQNALRTSSTPETSSAHVTVQTAARSGLIRISHALAAYNGTDYVYDDKVPINGSATIYAFDSGARYSHREFEGRVTFGADFSASNTTWDHYGHGTHVMAIALGKTYGVARQALGVSVKTLDDSGEGSISSIIQGIDWVLQQAGPNNLKVINLSFGGGYNAALNRVVDDAVSAGIHVVVSAGNEQVDVAQSSPASASKILTIGAIDDFGRAACYSNYGALDFVAPGNDVLSAWFNNNTATHLETGTSMAAPHVSGLIAYLLGTKGPMSPDQMKAELISLSTVNATGFPEGTVARIIYNGSTR